MEGDLEAERIVVLEHPPAAVGEHPRLRRAARQGTDHLLDVEPGLDGQDDALGNPEIRAREDHLVDGLDGLPGADRTDEGDGRAHRLERRASTFEVRGLAADEDREGAILRALAATGDRRIEHRHALFGQPRGEVPRRRGRDRGHVDDQCVASRSSSHAVRAEQHGFDVRGVGHDRDDDIRRGRHSARALDERDAEFAELARPTRGPVPGRDREARPGDIGGHRPTHGAESHETDAHSFLQTCQAADRTAVTTESISRARRGRGTGPNADPRRRGAGVRTGRVRRS